MAPLEVSGKKRVGCRQYVVVLSSLCQIEKRHPKQAGDHFLRPSMPPGPDTVRSRSLQAPSHRPSSSHLEDQSVTIHTDKDTVIFDREKNTMPIPEVIGLPLDGHWDHDAAYDHRYCFQHGEDEYLLGTPASWMRSWTMFTVDLR